MRRSAAPSQLGSANKRARFTPPFAVKQSANQQTCLQAVSKPSTTNQHTSLYAISKGNGKEGTSRQNLLGTKRDVLHLVQNKPKPEIDPSATSTDPDNADSNRTNACVSVPNRSKSVRSFINPQKDTTQSANLTELDSSSSENAGGESSSKSIEIKESYEKSSFPCKTTVHKLDDDSATNNIGDKTEEESKSTPVALVRRRMPGLQRSTFRQPLLQKGNQSSENVSTSDAGSRQDKSEDEGVICHYYNVMWCKLSKKKHKKWEGDAVLITKKRSVTLLDMEGKEIGNRSGYKIKDLETMKEGQTLVIGGKEIEVMGEISEAEFSSGKCFQAVSTSVCTSSSATYQPVISKPFLNPQKGTHAREKLSVDRPVSKPLFDLTVPGALVMPRPNATHQWENNHNTQTIVDVVVDPYLASKLRPHQREGVQFLYECIMGMRAFAGNGAILADDMGLGKTLQCITLIWTLYKQGPYGGRPQVKRVIVITPGSLVKNWCGEFRKWLGNERIRAFDVGTDKKVDEFARSPIYPVMVISYEMFIRSIAEIEKIKFDLIICDEGHRLKNTNIKTTSLIMGLPCRRRILLTGTPVQNDLQEFFAIVEFCNPGVLGSSGAFHRVYEDPILRSRQPGATKKEKELGETRAAELSRLTSLFVLRRTQEINNKYLPPKVETVVFCRPTALQLSLYHKLLASRVIRRCLTSATYLQEASPHLVCIAALKKLCNHPCLIYKACVEAEEGNEMGGNKRKEMYEEEEVSLYKDLLSLYPDDFNSNVANVEYSGKLQVLSTLLKAMHAGDVKEKIVLVSNYTQTLDVLQRLCDAEGYQYSRLDGSTPTTKRQHIVEQFNAKYSQNTVFLLSSKAGGVGLNLIGASRLVLYDIDWNPANDLQAMARVWRDGQRRTVFIYRFITTGTLEEKVYQRQISKQGLSSAVLDAKIGAQTSNVKFSQEDLKDLFTLHEGASCVTHDMLGCDCQDGQPTKQLDATQSNISSRPCQLGSRGNQQASKNLCMDELMEWRHYAGPLDEDYQDAYLASAREFITYIFQNITNMATECKSS
ncbi:DNA repair and recombination protein RAD54B-like [Amphiura filiformis]|uniref:DNA repair and recombination protein RAD54B-like n=1 Tax=Amphiura filiformis TaxID=82378 RepID=UPI003B221679